MVYDSGKIREQFLSLIVSGMYGVPADKNLLADCDWQEIIKTAREQAVTGLLVDGMETLPEGMLPEKTIRQQLVSSVLMIEKANRNTTKTLCAFSKLLNSEGFRHFIVKGQVIAAEYVNPLHREPGDIDIWIPDAEEAEKAFRWAGNNFRCRWMPGEKETSFTWNGALIELHRRMADMQYRSYQKNLQDILSHGSSNPRTVSLYGMDILTLPDEIMLVYLLVHAEYHILNEGLGLRQLCDIAIFIKKHFTAEDSIQDKLDRCGISQISAAIGHILHKDLGLDKNLIPFRISSKGAEIIREDIWAGGNFGKKRYGHVSNYNFIHRKLTMLPVHCRQYLRYRELLPNEAWANLISKFGRAAKGIK